MGQPAYDYNYNGITLGQAGRLGLMKIDDSQITYIRLDDQSVLTRRESAVEKWTDTLQAGVSSLLRTIDPPADAAE